MSNTYRDPAGNCRLLDWQLVHRANGMRDVANFLSSALPPDVRRAHDDALLERYAGVLAEGGVPDVPSLGELRDLYRLFLVQTLGAAIVGLAFTGRMSVDGAARRALGERRLAAIDELEVAGYIRHRLGRDS